MIKNDFYNDPNWVWQRGNGVFTKPIVDLSRTYNAFSGGETDWAAPYYMGYIPWTDFPQHFTPFSISIDNDAQNITFNNLCVGKNIPWFYTCFKESNSRPISYSEMIFPLDYESSTSIWVNVDANETDAWVSNTSGHCLINEMEIIKCTQGGTFPLYYMCFKVDQVNGVSDIYSGTKNLTFSQLKDFFEGTGTLSLEIAGQSTLDVNSSMIADNNCLIYSESTYKYVFMCGGILIPDKMCNANGYVYDNYLNLKIGFRLPFPEKNTGNYLYTIYYIPNGSLRTMGINNAPCLGFRRVGDTMVKRDAIAQHVVNYGERYFGGLNDTISFSDFPDNPGADRTAYKWDERGYLFKTSKPYHIDCDMFWSANWRSCYNFILMLNKFDETTGGYPASSSTYDLNHPVAMFNSNDDPTGESVNETYARVEPKLREWQKAGKSISDDDFDVDNMPPDEPSEDDDTPPDEPQDLPHDEGEPTDDQDDRTLTAPTCFLTQYAMGYSQLQTVGVNLWQSWLTPNLETWKNFFFAFAEDTGTLDIGAALNFIISLRVFPFNLAGLTTDYISPTNGVYMGTGHTNFCPNASNLFKLNTVIGYLDCGTCEVVPETPYNDFRDMYNCSVLCFLPYCGTVELTPAEVIGRTLHVKYHIDFQSGACTAIVKVVGDKGEYTVASKSGQIGFTLPVTATNAGQLSAQFAKDATQTMGTIGGFFFKAAHAQADNLNSLANAFISKPKAINTDSNGNKSLSVFSNNTFETSTKIGEAGFNTGLSLANQALDMLSRSGIDVPAISGGMGAESMMQPDCCFVQIRRGKYAKPVNYPHSQGYINGSSNTISHYRGMFQGTPTYPNSNNKGLCKFTGVDSTGLTCHDDERAEIIALLESGVYL